MSARSIFLSYTSQDAEPARRLCERLRAAGLEVWFDQSELRGGDAWDASIRKRIKDCTLFVPIISSNTEARSEGYFRLEWKLAVDRSHLMADDQPFLLPVVIDDTPEATARVPDGFRARQWTRLPGGETPAAFVEIVERLLAGGVPPPSTSRSASAAPSSGGFAGFGGRPAIAVLPFDNLSRDPEQEPFADGLAEDLINRLSLWRALPVISRNSSFTWKGRTGDLKQVAADLGVRYVVQGSIRKAGQRVRIAAKLADALTGQQVWTQTYDRDLTDVFAVQDEISEAIATSLMLDLNRAEQDIAQRRDPESLEAWGLYQRALPLIYHFNREDLDAARALLARAIALDPRFAPALARYAEVHVWDIILGWTQDFDRSIAIALDHARRAVHADPRDAEARAQLAFSLMTSGDGYAAIEEARRGLDLNPSNIWVLLLYAYLWHMTGNPPQDSIDLVERARRLSPRDPAEWLFYDILAGAYLNAGRYEEGLAAAKRLTGLWPTYGFGYIWCAMNAAALGRIDEARGYGLKAREVQPDMSVAVVRQMLGATAPEVDRRIVETLQLAGVPD